MKRKSYDPIPKKRRYFMLVALVVIVALVCYQIWDVSYSYSIRGERGVIGLSGYLLWFLFTYISFELTFAIDGEVEILYLFYYLLLLYQCLLY